VAPPSYQSLRKYEENKSSPLYPPHRRGRVLSFSIIGTGVQVVQSIWNGIRKEKDPPLRSQSRCVLNGSNIKTTLAQRCRGEEVGFHSFAEERKASLAVQVKKKRDSYFLRRGEERKKRLA